MARRRKSTRRRSGKRAGGIMGKVRSIFSLRGLIHMAIGAIAVKVIEGPVEAGATKAAGYIKGLFGKKGA